MAVLDTLNRFRVMATYMRNWNQLGIGDFPNVNKVELQAAVDATDAWIDANAASFVAALPTAFRNASSGPQKTVLFCYVAMRRAGILDSEED